MGGSTMENDSSRLITQLHTRYDWKKKFFRPKAAGDDAKIILKRLAGVLSKVYSPRALPRVWHSSPWSQKIAANWFSVNLSKFRGWIPTTVTPLGQFQLIPTHHSPNNWFVLLLQLILEQPAPELPPFEQLEPEDLSMRQQESPADKQDSQNQ